MNNNKWILAFTLFMLFDESSEVLKLLNAKDFEKEYKKMIENLKKEDAEHFKNNIIFKLQDNKSKFKKLNKAQNELNIY